jgi:NTP pyrophosphatase (non-canonical NTP hydrolase)
MNIRQYHREVQRTAPNESMRDSMILACLGLTGEAGECADIIKKHLYHAHGLDLDKLRKEMGDVLWYLTFLCDVLGITLSELMEANAAKLRARYPTGFDTERSINRTAEA